MLFGQVLGLSKVTTLVERVSSILLSRTTKISKRSRPEIDKHRLPSELSWYR